MLNKSKRATDGELQEAALFGLVMGGDAILLSERQGQADLVSASKGGTVAHLPWDFGIEGQPGVMRNYDYPYGHEMHHRDAGHVLQSWGIEIVTDPVEASKSGDLFFDVRLPEGWRIEPTEHSMYTNLVDANGWVRASIFYKAAFYDRKASISLRRFWEVGRCPVGGYDDGYMEWRNAHPNDSLPDVAYVQTTERFTSRCKFDHVLVFETEPTRTDVPPKEGEHAYEARERQEAALIQVARDWLTENYPDWKSYTAYWDLEPVAIDRRTRTA